MLNERTVYKITEEQVYYKAMQKMRKAHRCCLSDCSHCEPTREAMRRHIKRDHTAWELARGLNMRCDMII